MPTGDIFEEVGSLNSKEARKVWESEFNSYYIHPVLSNLDSIFSKTWDIVASEDKQGKYWILLRKFNDTEIETI